MALVAEAKARGERVVLTNGVFDILHAGHVSYLEEAKSCGDRLIVAVNDDDSVRRLKGATRPVNSLADRMAVLAGLASVDWVVPFGEDTPAELIAQVLPNVLVKGGDYRVEQIAGGDTVLKNGGEVRVLGFKPGRSTTRLDRRAAPLGRLARSARASVAAELATATSRRLARGRFPERAGGLLQQQRVHDVVVAAARVRGLRAAQQLLLRLQHVDRRLRADLEARFRRA